MAQTETLDEEAASVTEHFDVVIVGAGISGVGGAYHLTKECPGKSFVVLEALESFGGTWLTHRYPGIRSDSDLYTFGYRFKPWTGAPIATAAEIRTYMGEVIEDNDLGRHIRYGHTIARASWSSATTEWTLEVTRTDTGEALRVTAGFLWMCQGYYRHSEGYTPDWPGMDRYQGRIVHPQTWPDDLDYKDKTVVVIGSGATAATLVPAIAPDCAHVTVLQRSPTYFFSGANSNELADTLRELEINEEWIHEIVRRKILHEQHAITELSFEQPEFLAKELINDARGRLPAGYDVETHFTPKYRPWRQRIAFLPDGDLFAGISSGKASMATDEIETFTEQGILLKSGRELEADIIITATGFNLCVLGDIAFSIDGEPLVFSDTINYRGMMFTGVPNMVWVFGYFRASWTLRADMISDFVCRLLNHMQEMGVSKVTPALRPEDADMPVLPWIDPENFNPGYLMRGVDLLPKRLDKPEWRHTQDYWAERDELPGADLDDGCLVYERGGRRMTADDERPVHGPPRPDGGLLHAAAGQLQEMFGVHRQLDHVLYESAKRVGGVEFESIFNPISPARIAATPRMDAINHDQVFLRSSPMSAADTEAAVGLLEILHGDFAAPNIEAFAEFTEREKFFERLADGQSFVFVGSHLEFQDVGFNLGYLTRAAQRRGFDRLDTRTTLMIGRLLGYLEVMGMNVIDDILRKAGNVLKTFPVSGGEAVNEGDITDEDLNRRVKAFRKRQNARTRGEFMNLMTSDHGHVVIEAGSGSRDAKDAHGYVVMEPFAAGTREDLYFVARAGAAIYPVFGDYGDRKEPSIVEFGPEIRHLDSPQHAHAIGEMIASIGNRARGAASQLHPDVARFRIPIRYGNYDS